MKVNLGPGTRSHLRWIEMVGHVLIDEHTFGSRSRSPRRGTPGYPLDPTCRLTLSSLPYRIKLRRRMVSGIWFLFLHIHDSYQSRPSHFVRVLIFTNFPQGGVTNKRKGLVEFTMLIVHGFRDGSHSDERSSFTRFFL